MDFVAICVPSPLDGHGQPDLSYIVASAESVGAHLSEGAIVVLESTTYPGTTEELVRKLLEERSGLRCGEGFYLGFSPERVDPGNASYHTGNTPKVVGGVGEEATRRISAVYGSVLSSEIHPVSSPAVAEMEKILENTYRNVNIALVNEMAVLCEKMGIDVWEVIEAAATKPYGFQAFYPGPGLGGHCIPLDPSYLSWKAREYAFHTSMIEASGAVNDRMPEYCVDRAAAILNRERKALNGSRVLVLGVAYKPGIGDCRESASIRVIDLLEKRGAEVAFHDPYVRTYEHDGRTRVGLEALDEGILRGFDLVIVATAHASVDYDLVQRGARRIFDTRNAMKDVAARGNIELL
jgi:UDP-N-acetyl-D-glucosamine dehydrogenase